MGRRNSGSITFESAVWMAAFRFAGSCAVPDITAESRRLGFRPAGQLTGASAGSPGAGGLGVGVCTGTAGLGEGVAPGAVGTRLAGAGLAGAGTGAGGS